MPRKFDVFISHVSGDSGLAAALRNSIERDFNALTVFVSSDNHSIEAGEWFKQVKAGLKDARVVIVLCSPVSIRSTWVAFEAGAAWLRKGTRLVLLCHSGLPRSNLPTPFHNLEARSIDTDGIRWIYDQITTSFDSIRRAPPEDAVAAALDRLQRAVQKIDLDRQLRSQVTSVMALSFRDGAGGREYLLVRTKSGDKWVFPKGTIEAGTDTSDYIESLRKELLEEAGAAGRVYDQPYGPFPYVKNIGELRQVLAFPVEVQRTGAPREAARGPRWCSFDEARRLLQDGRQADTALGLVNALQHVAAFRGQA